MKKLFVLLLLFSFISAQFTIPLGNVVDPETQTPEGNNNINELNDLNEQNETSLTQTSEGSAESAEIRLNQTSERSNDSVTGDSIANDTNDSMTEYLIESGDLLEIVILGEEELSRTLMVMHNGTISFPLIGEVKVAGLTTEQAVELLVEKLKKYFTQPVVSIIFKSPTLPYVSVFGEVLRQGAVEYQRGLRVSDYIALAGGPGSRANLGKVKVVRFQQGIPVATTINVNDIINKGLMENNFELKSGDWIQVSKKFTINWGVVLGFLTLSISVLNLYITLDRLD